MSASHILKFSFRGGQHTKTPVGGSQHLTHQPSQSVFRLAWGATPNHCGFPKYLSVSKSRRNTAFCYRTLCLRPFVLNKFDIFEIPWRIMGFFDFFSWSHQLSNKVCKKMFPVKSCPVPPFLYLLTIYFVVTFSLCFCICTMTTIQINNRIMN